MATLKEAGEEEDEKAESKAAPADGSKVDEWDGEEGHQARELEAPVDVDGAHFTVRLGEGLFLQEAHVFLPGEALPSGGVSVHCPATLGHDRELGGIEREDPHERSGEDKRANEPGNETRRKKMMPWKRKDHQQRRRGRAHGVHRSGGKVERYERKGCEGGRGCQRGNKNRRKHSSHVSRSALSPCAAVEWSGMEYRYVLYLRGKVGTWKQPRCSRQEETSRLGGYPCPQPPT